jgi:hypothetical protein
VLVAWAPAVRARLKRHFTSQLDWLRSEPLEKLLFILRQLIEELLPTLLPTELVPIPRAPNEPELSRATVGATSPLLHQATETDSCSYRNIWMVCLPGHAVDDLSFGMRTGHSRGLSERRTPSLVLSPAMTHSRPPVATRSAARTPSASA